MKKSVLKIFTASLSVLILFCAALALTACDTESETANRSSVRYDVAFESNGGTTYYTLRAENGDIVTLPAPQREGYEFDGWYLSSAFDGTPLGEEFTVSSEVRLYAKWTPYEGVISFESNGGTEYQDVSFSAQKISLPAPEKEGHVFLGWYDNESFSGQAFSDVILPSESMVLYAKWGKITGAVSFESDGGTQFKRIETAGQKVFLPVPEKENYIFVGWYDNAEFSGAVYRDTVLPDGELTLYAKWAKYFNIVTLDVNGGKNIAPVINYDSEDLSLPVPVKFGYAFVGWYDNAELAGNAVNGYYKPLGDVTLYAKWKKITYLYLYYGTGTDYVRYEYDEGDVVTTTELYELFTPSPLKEYDIFGNEHEAPFAQWVYEGYDENSHIDLTSDITIGSEHVILVAEYDYSNVPAKEYIKYSAENDEYTTTGKVDHVFIDEAPQTPYAYSTEMTIVKGKSGAVGPAFRMSVPNTNYHYEADSTYLAPGICPGDGSVQISSVLNGKWSRFVSIIPLSSLPSAWIEKFNAVESGFEVDLTMTVVDKGSSFELYIDNDLAFSYSGASMLNNYTGKSLGLRSSSTPTKFGKFYVTEGYTVSFDTGCDTEVGTVRWFVGSLDVPVPERDGYALEGWYYDKALTQRVDDEDFFITEDTTLYAKWSDSYYVVTFDSLGGSLCGSINWAAGKLVFPETPVKMSRIFTGWYYDRECGVPVDAYEFSTDKDVTLYAGWRYPYHYLTENGDGTYTYTKKTLAVLGTMENGIPADGDYNEISQTVTMLKGDGSNGIAFRMDVGVDYAYETVGTSYLSVQFAGSGLRISYVDNGAWRRLLPANADYTFDKLPQSWKDKYNSTADGTNMTVKLTIKDFGSYFEVYIDDMLAYTYGQNGETVDLTRFSGNGYGVRCSSQNTVIYGDIYGTTVSAT